MSEQFTNLKSKSASVTKTSIEKAINTGAGTISFLGSYGFIAGNVTTASDTIKMGATAQGSVIFGSAGKLVGDGTNLIAAYGPGSFVGGDAVASTGFTGTIQSLAAGTGAFTWGYAGGGANALLQSTKQGAFAQGFAYKGTIQGTGPGSFAQGGVYRGTLTSSGNGSFAQGYIYGVHVITASANGAFAQGYSKGTLTATASGAFAQGYAGTGVTLSATAVNAAQFGPGTNSLANSLKVGTAGLRFIGTVGAPTVPVNGDFWVDAGGVVNVRSGGATHAL